MSRKRRKPRKKKGDDDSPDLFAWAKGPRNDKILPSLRAGGRDDEAAKLAKALRKSKLQIAYENFDRKHPEIYELLLWQARIQKELGAKHSTIALCFEEIRGDLPLEKDNCAVKLNNNHRAYYARKIMDEHPEFKGFFRLRRQKIQCTFGPDNDTLESGEHRH